MLANSKQVEIVIRVIPPVASLARRRAELWRRDLENLRSSWGVRCLTLHVTEERWLDYWLEGKEPSNALLAELRFID